MKIRSPPLKILQKNINNYKYINSKECLDQILDRRLPKICINDENKKIKNIIETVNEVLESKVTEGLSMIELHKLFYCGAKTVIEICVDQNIPVYDQKDIPRKFPEDKNEQEKLLKMSPLTFRRLLLTFEDTLKKPEIPTKEEIEDRWSNLWENSNDYDENNAKDYIAKEIKRMKAVEWSDVTSSEITDDELGKVLKKKKLWCPPGVDGLQLFWYKHFKSLHEVLLKNINKIVRGEEEMPEFFTRGLTVLTPKINNALSIKAENKTVTYRPITHLPTIYKIITRCVYEKIFTHYQNPNFEVLADEQCGGRRGCFGVRKALVIDSVALQQEPLWGCYVDYKKAFDMVPHGWVLKMLRVYKVDDTLVNFVEQIMTKWKTRIYLDSDKSIFTRILQLKRGIFYGDPLSVLLYWTCVNPLSFALRRTKLGLEDGKLSHLLYIDDLKLYSSNLEDLKIIFRKVHSFTNAISMKINFEKTHVFSKSNEHFVDPLDFGVEIPIRYSNTENYLGYEQEPTINHDTAIYGHVVLWKKMLEKIEQTKISDTEKSKIKNITAMNFIGNSFGVLDWTIFMDELLKLKFKRKKSFDINIFSEKCQKPIYMKLMHQIYKMRGTFYKQDSTLMKLIIKNDKTTTPLQLFLNRNEFITSLAKKLGKKRGTRRNRRNNKIKLKRL